MRSSQMAGGRRSYREKGTSCVPSAAIPKACTTWPRGFTNTPIASGDEQSHQAAVALLKKLFRDFNSPAFRYLGADFPYLWGSKRAVRPQGLWFLNLTLATQMLQHENDPEIAAIAATSVDAIMNRHYNPDIGLNTEMLYFDFTRPPRRRRSRASAIASRPCGW